MRFILFALSLAFAGCKSASEKVQPSIAVSDYCRSNIDSLEMSAQALGQAVAANDLSKARQAFNDARKYYKRIESITEFYFPSVSKALNGPAIDKLEEDDEKVIVATGFQVVEEVLFSKDINGNISSELGPDVRILSSIITRLREVFAGTELTNENFFEAMRLQMLRIMSLGISGFDSPVQLNSLKEAAHSLEGMETLLSFYAEDLSEHKKHLWQEVQLDLHASRRFLTSDNFDNFNRADFITDYLNPLCSSVFHYQKALAINNNKHFSALDLSKENFFLDDVYNEHFFSPRREHTSNQKVRDLGRILFFDPILSGNNKRSCASCHRPSKAFSDGLDKSLSFESLGRVQRNAPTLINSAYQQSQFWDGRVAFIEDQITQVIDSETELHGSFDEAIIRLMKSPEYVRLFAQAFATEGQPVTESTIQRALAAYVRSLASFNSRFDRFMRGDSALLTDKEIAGFNVFMGKAKCGTCHFLPLFNGTVPPLYKESESEVLGIPAKAVVNSARIDPDHGKFYNFPHPLLDNMFKTPTVRNAALTAPYMHNGVYRTLKEVIDFYDVGGGAGIGIQLENQTLPTDSLHLTESEKEQIISFLHTLTDTTGLTEKPARLPFIKDAALDERTLGGDY